MTDNDFASRDDPVTAIRNIGPAQQAALARAGIQSATHLRDLGADAAYDLMLRSGTRPHFIGYYSLVMGLQGRPWNDCRGAERDFLRTRFDALVAGVSGGGGEAIEGILDQLGTGRHR